MRKIEEVYINGVCLKDILNQHKKWLKHEEGGIRADLSNLDLNGVDFSGVDFRRAYFKCTNFTGSHFKESHFSGADFTRANFREAYFTGTDLVLSNLRETNFIGAYLKGINFTGANLAESLFSRANLNYVNFAGANLTDVKFKETNLSHVIYSETTSFYNLQCPEKGSFIGFKKADDKIVELLITEDAKRSSATSRKCRCSKAKVLSITSADGTKEYKEVRSDRDENFIYKVGEIVRVDNFDEDRWNECSTGIHFFITREEAVNY